MRNRGLKAAACALAALAASCDVNRISGEMFRSDPFPDTVETEVVSAGLAVRLRWREDGGADQYAVMKSTYDEAGFGSFEVVYAGTETNYIDRGIDGNYNYAYRLDKKRGTKVFEGTGLTLFDRTRPDVFSGMVTAQNLNNGKSAYLVWEADPGADRYRIMRAVNDGSALAFVERIDGADGFSYQGETSAIDGTLADDVGYFYRLDKERDGVWRPGTKVTIFSRTRPAPYAEDPKASSFRPDGYISLTWGADEGADEYELYREYDDPYNAKVKELAYRGKYTQFLDRTVNSDQNWRYAYYLVKIRNGASYDSGRTLAVAVKTQEDAHEPNNVDYDATVLEDYRQGNVYYFCFTTGEEVIDMDWYKVNVPPGKTANVSVAYTNSANDEFFNLYDPFKETAPIVHNTAFSLRNDGPVQKFIYFAIQPNKSKFLGMNTYGGQVASYTITWVGISSNP
jgi:hypothetical protein